MCSLDTLVNIMSLSLLPSSSSSCYFCCLCFCRERDETMRLLQSWNESTWSKQRMTGTISHCQSSSKSWIKRKLGVVQAELLNITFLQDN